MVGPEGGISDEELAALEQAGAVAVELGPAVLRTSDGRGGRPRCDRLCSPVAGGRIAADDTP